MPTNNQKYAAWLSEPSVAAVDIAALAGYGSLVLDIEHGMFDLGDLDWIIPYAQGRGLKVIAKVLGPERGPIQQALDFGADAVAIPHVESAEHAKEVCGFAKFPPLGDRSFAGGRTTKYRGFDDEWVTAQDRETRCYAMIEDASAFEEIEQILGLDVVDGIFVGPSDLSLRRDRGAYSAAEGDFLDIAALAAKAREAGKPWVFPAWSLGEQELAVKEGADTVVIAMQFGALLSGLSSSLDTFKQIEAGQ